MCNRRIEFGNFRGSSPQKKVPELQPMCSFRELSRVGGATNFQICPRRYGFGNFRCIAPSLTLLTVSARFARRYQEHCSPFRLATLAMSNIAHRFGAARSPCNEITHSFGPLRQQCETLLIVSARYAALAMKRIHCRVDPRPEGRRDTRFAVVVSLSPDPLTPYSPIGE